METITRVLPGRKKKKIESEVIVRFTSVQVRDMVVSYAPNLRNWREQDGSGRTAAGLRLEIPDHLMAVFKTLEKYGHYLKEKYKDGLRRHIRYDDYNMTLVIDYALPGKDKWDRVDFETAREELRSHPPSSFTYNRSSSSSVADGESHAKGWRAPAAASSSAEQNEEEDSAPQQQEERMEADI